MDIVEMLVAGHRHVTEQKKLLDKIVKMIDEDAFFWDNAAKLTEFFKFEVREHFKIEEKVLFPVVARVLTGPENERLKQIEAEHGPILALLSEFELIASDHLKAANKTTRVNLARVAGELLAKIIPHAQSEDELLLPAIRERFGPAHFKELESLYFTYIEAG